MDLPEFLQNASVDEIHGQMLNSMPDDIDKSQGQHPYNYTRPTALIVSEMCQQTLPQVIKQIWPMTAFGEWITTQKFGTHRAGLQRHPLASYS